MIFDFKTNKSEDTVLINMCKWVENDTNLIQSYKMSGRQIPTYITETVDSNIVSKKYKEDTKFITKGSLLLLTRAVSELANFRSYTVLNKKYYNVPVSHIIGVFKDNIINVDSLELTSDKVLVEEVIKEQNNMYKGEDKSFIGSIIKTGKCNYPFKIGSKVLIKDNVSTPLMINGKKYHSINSQDIVGIFKEDNLYTLDNLELINESIIMDIGYEKQDSNSFLLKPIMDYEDLDYSDIYNRDIFSVIKSDPKLTKISKDDIIIVNRDATCYVYIDCKKYFIINEMKNVEGKFINE